MVLIVRCQSLNCRRDLGDEHRGSYVQIWNLMKGSGSVLCEEEVVGMGEVGRNVP